MTESVGCPRVAPREIDDFKRLVMGLQYFHDCKCYTHNGALVFWIYRMEYDAMTITKEAVAFIDKARMRKDYEKVGRILSALLFDDEDTSDLDNLYLDVIDMLRVGTERLSYARERAKEKNRQRVKEFRQREKDKHNDCNDYTPLQNITNGVKRSVMKSNECNAHVNVNVNDDDNVKENVKEINKEKQEKETPTSGDDILIDERFEKFWQEYPTYRRTDKKKCREKFMRIIKKSKDSDIYQKIMEGLNHWKQSEMWNSDGGKFVCAPMVWLNNERWNDEIQKQAQQSKIQQSKYIQNPENSRSASWVGEGAEDLLRELKEATNR